jgi:hypothetical protein
MSVAFVGALLDPDLGDKLANEADVHSESKVPPYGERAMTFILYLRPSSEHPNSARKI